MAAVRQSARDIPEKWLRPLCTSQLAGVSMTGITIGGRHVILGLESMGIRIMLVDIGNVLSEDYSEESLDVQHI